jgi:hypothetical protein
MMDHLTGIEDIDWGKWSHAYGPATDVPGCIRALVSQNLDAQVAAKWELYGSLWHQGTIYEATVHAVPWLIKVLADPLVDRAWLVTYIAHIAMGASYKAQHADLDFIDASTSVYQKQMALELEWVETARASVVAGASMFESLLQDSDPEVRAAALHLFSAIPEVLPAHAEAVRALTHDIDPMVRATAILALVFGPESMAQASRDAAERALIDISAAVRWAGAYALAFHPDLDSRVVELLLGGLHSHDAIQETMDGSPFIDDGVDSMSARALANIGPEDAPEAIDELMQQIQRAHPVQALTLLSTLLYLVFGNSEAPHVAQMNSQQLRALGCVVSADPAWQLNGNTWTVLSQWGLPGDREALRVFLAFADTP